jgi:hypothetical protein
MPDEPRNLMIAGLDIGKTQDQSVLAVIERLEGDPPKGDLVYLETWPLGTNYPDFTDRLRYLFDQPPLRRSIPIVVDARGPGAPVVDELGKAGFAVVPVMLHGGARTSRDSRGAFGVPKERIVYDLLLAAQSDRLIVSWEGPEADAFAQQCKTLVPKMGKSGHLSYEARRAIDHDDIPMAVSLAWWYLCRHPGTPAFPDFYPHHIGASPLEALRGGLGIVRGWDHERPCCVFMQLPHEGRALRILYAVAPDRNRGLVETGQLVRRISGQLFLPYSMIVRNGEASSGFQDLGPPAMQERSYPGGKSPADLLRPGIMVQRGRSEWEAQREIGHKFLSQMVNGGPALLIDPREACVPVVRAFQGECRYPWVRGEAGKTPEDNDAFAIVRAVLVALATPSVTMSEGARRRVMGPAVFGPSSW